MENSENIMGILGFTLIVLTLVISHKGMIYDTSKEKIDKKYKNNHSIRWSHGRFWFSFPGYIVDETNDNKIKKIKNSYNFYSIIFWFVAFVIFIMAIGG
jgi:hypothetical protein